MIAIRGATTIDSDTPEQIKNRVKELLVEIKEKNSIQNTDIICIMFSSTSDIKSFYPAKAAREAGFVECALYSSSEPDIYGALNKCIRVMVLAELSKSPMHVYLHRASVLRKDISEIINIAVDGPAGSGKSTVSDIVAKRLSILHLDTGAMYRACALACMGIDLNDDKAIENVVKDISVEVKYVDGKQKTLLYKKDVSKKIRTPEVSLLASKISANKFVRIKMSELQREVAKKNSCILDGRDIGTNVLPECKYKFYLSASDEIRAKRRMAENAQNGIIQEFSEVLCEIKQRDKQDMGREFAPLMKAKDAIEIDTGNLTADEVAELIIENIQSRI